MELLLTEQGAQLKIAKTGKLSHSQKAHYNAIKHWLNIHQPAPMDSYLDQVKGYLEAFHHFCELQEWQNASKLLFVNLSIPYTKELHRQLGNWGYYEKQIELYQQLLHKLSPDLDCLLLQGLGKAYHSLSRGQVALRYYEQLLKLAKQVSNRKAEAQAYGGFGIVQRDYFVKVNAAILHHKKQLEIALEISDFEEEANALKNLGLDYYNLDDYRKALKYLEASLQIARNIDSLELQLQSIANLGRIYSFQGKTLLANKYLQEQIHLSKQLHYHQEQCTALMGLNNIFIIKKDYLTGLTYLYDALKLVNTVNELSLKCDVFNRLGATYQRIKKYPKSKNSSPELEHEQLVTRFIQDRNLLNRLEEHYPYSQEYEIALYYHEQALTIATQLESLYQISNSVFNLAILHSTIGQHDRAIYYIQKNQSLAGEIDTPDTKMQAVLALVHYHWCKGDLLYAVILSIRAFIICPPWQNINTRMAFTVIITEILKALIHPLQISFQKFLALIKKE